MLTGILQILLVDDHCIVRQTLRERRKQGQEKKTGTAAYLLIAAEKKTGTAAYLLIAAWAAASLLAFGCLLWGRRRGSK